MWVERVFDGQRLAALERKASENNSNLPPFCSGLREERTSATVFPEIYKVILPIILCNHPEFFIFQTINIYLFLFLRTGQDYFVDLEKLYPLHVHATHGRHRDC